MIRIFSGSAATSRWTLLLRDLFLKVSTFSSRERTCSIGGMRLARRRLQRLAHPFLFVRESESIWALIRKSAEARNVRGPHAGSPRGVLVIARGKAKRRP